MVCVSVFSLSSCASHQRSGKPSHPDLDSALAYAETIHDHIPPGAAAQTSLEDEWRKVLEDVVSALKEEAPLRQWKGKIMMQGWTVHFPEQKSLLALNPHWFNDIRVISAAGKVRSSLRSVSAPGTGLPLMMYQAYDPERASSVKLFPLNGRYLPATLTASFTGPRAVTLTFHHTAKVTHAIVRGRDRPLAYDLSAPLLKSMDPGFLSAFAGAGLFRPDRHLDDTGVFVPGIFDPDKIPVVFVHGLASDPHIWDAAMNDVLADPILRQKYQIWYFLYPTGLPVQVSAARLRSGLQKAVAHYDPQGIHPALRRMVLVGHSMGGLLSHLQVVDSGDDIYRAWFTQPLESLRISPANRQLIQRTLYFQHLPFVQRAIFVATPHRGSAMAEMRIVRLALRFVHRVVRLDQLMTDVIQNAAHALNPGLHWDRGRGGRSVDTLAASHPMLKALDRRPILVPWHNIIAVWKPRPNLTETTDGAVPYTSAYLAGAARDFIVHGFHSCTEKPEVTAEICRILRLHARRY